MSIFLFFFLLDLSRVMGMIQMISMMWMQMMTGTTTMNDDELAFGLLVTSLEDLRGSVGDEQFPR